MAKEKQQQEQQPEPAVLTFVDANDKNMNVQLKSLQWKQRFRLIGSQRLSSVPQN